jgi:phenylacetate-CoA ligase
MLKVLCAANRYRELKSSQYWSKEELASYTTAHLDETLSCATTIKFYADHFGGTPRAEDFKTLPILPRNEVRRLNDSILSLHPRRSSFSSDSSSGSTGMPAEFLFDTSHQIGRFAARARYLRENGWNPLQRNAWLIYAVFRTANNDDERLMRSPIVLRSRFIPASPDLRDSVDALCRLDPVFLYTFPSYLEVLLNLLAETGGRLPSLKKLFTGAEVLEDSLRHRTKQFLGVDIAENYGSTEAFLGWQCPEGRLHVNAEHVLIEIVDEHGRAVMPGEIGKVLVTTLENRLAPLVRYEIGDYAVAAVGNCPCGRTLPLIGRIIGRGMNLFRLGDGRLISPWHLSTAVRQCLEVRQFQIVQNSVQHFTVRFVAERPLTNEAEETVMGGFRKVLGREVMVAFQKVAEIARTRGGKYMTAVSELGTG